MKHYFVTFRAEIATIEELLRAEVNRLGNAHVRRLLSEYLGLQGSESIRLRSKRLRGMLFLLVHRATPCGRRECEDVAGAVELVHNASLILDDVEDGHATRWNRCTLAGIVGDQQAVNIAVLCLLQAQRVLLGSDICRLRDWNDLFIRMCVGQSLDLAASLYYSGGLNGYVRMVLGKTAGLMRAAAMTGAHNMEWAIRRQIGRYATQLALAHQLQDDIDDLVEIRRGGQIPQSNFAWFITCGRTPEIGDAVAVGRALAEKCVLKAVDALYLAGLDRESQARLESIAVTVGRRQEAAVSKSVLPGPRCPA